MKFAFAGAFLLLGLSLLAMLLMWAYGAVGAALGQQWMSLDGPEPVWPAVIGFGAMNAAALSLAVIVLLAVVAGVRLGALLLTGRVSARWSSGS